MVAYLTYGEVTRLATGVATSTASGTTQAQSRAVSLDMSQTLAMIALLGLGGAGQGAAIGFVACETPTVNTLSNDEARLVRC